MTLIRQDSLFDIQELYEMEFTLKFEAVTFSFDLDSIYYAVNEKFQLDAPVKFNYAAMSISIFIRYVERNPTIKYLIKRLNYDFVLKLNCGFLVNCNMPS